MAIAINHAFTNPKADGADTTIVRPSDWNAALVWSGLGTNQLLYSTGATALAQSANLTFGDTLLAAGPGIQVGSGGTTSNGWIIGYGGATGQAGIWPTSVTPSGANFALLATSTQTTLNGLSNVFIATAGGTKAIFDTNAGSGPSYTMGTATTDVGSRVTQTWNNAAVAFTAAKIVITDTASAAGSLAMQILGGAAGTTSLFKVSKAGLIDAPAYAVGGTAGLVSFSGAVTNITVVNGIVTAAS